MMIRFWILLPINAFSFSLGTAFQTPTGPARVPFPRTLSTTRLIHTATPNAASAISDGLPTRRTVLQTVGVAATTAAPIAAQASASTSTNVDNLLIDLPMIRIQLPGNNPNSINNYIATEVHVGDRTALFLIDTGLSLELITPHLKRQLDEDDDEDAKHRRSSSKDVVQSYAAGGRVPDSELLELRNVRVGDLPRALTLSNFHALVRDFPQEHLDPQHDPVDGMIGMETLLQYDVEFDFGAQRLRFYRPGTAYDAVVRTKQPDQWLEIPAVVINDTGLLGIRVTTTASPQPVLGVVDCGATVSVANAKAAAIWGLRPDDATPRDRLFIQAVDVEGRPLQIPTVRQRLTFVGDAQVDAQGRVVGFDTPPWSGWNPIQLGIGDLPALTDLLGDGVRRYDGPAALLGLDLWGQKRQWILEGVSPMVDSTSGKHVVSRRRRMFLHTTDV
jgi:Aspartyl protease